MAVLDKPSGWTSHDVVGRVRRILGTRRVGHAGTLDPMATGVLVVGVGRATRLLGHLALTDKSYAATIRLGSRTVTDDAEGEVIEALGAEGLRDEDLAAAVAGLRGSLLQVPSAVSAIKVGGVRSYVRARAGHSVDLAPRPVTVHRFEVRARRAAGRHVDLDVLVDCTTGTYIRALARDLGSTLGTGGHLIALRRTRVGAFTLDEAQVLGADTDELAVTPIEEVAARSFATGTVSDEQAAAVRHGRRLPSTPLPADPTALFDRHGNFLALYRPADGDAVAEAVFAPFQGNEPPAEG